MEKKEIQFFLIDDKFYGGNQNWHINFFVRMGGCSTVCACEACICTARTFPDMSGLYPYDPFKVTKRDFLNFFDLMHNYIYPGLGGLSKISRFERMLEDYVYSVNIDAKVCGLEGYEDYSKAEDFIISSIDCDLPVMCLLLMHENIEFDKYEWHWFNITGYEKKSDDMFIKAATWGVSHKLHLWRMWHTGKVQRGGLVRLQPAGLSVH